MLQADAHVFPPRSRLRARGRRAYSCVIVFRLIGCEKYHLTMSFQYTNVQYTEMVRTLAVCGDNVSLAVRRYEEQFGIRVSWNTMLSATQRSREYGTFRPPTAVDRGVSRIPTTVQEGILNYIASNPESSTTRAGTIFNVSQPYAWRTLRDDGQYPYHFRRAQELCENDREQRILFCRWWLNNRNASILWTDECTFTRRGLYNIHNSHYWGHENPHLARADSYQHRFSVNVWAGIVNSYVIGPIYLPRLNSASYLNFLTNTLPDILDDLPLDIYRGGRGIYYQHDGAPAHYSRQVREYLNQEYGDQWIGRGGPVQWPPRSPDLTPLDFYLWGHVKDQTEPQSEADLINKIESAFNSVKNNRYVLNKINRNLRKRARLCIRQRGGHFEQLMQ